MRKFSILFFLLLILLVTAYVWFYYFNERSNGTRTGLINKLSRKGDIFKTYEGEMIQSGMRSLSSNTFFFSVQDPNIYDSLEKLSRTSKIVTVHYMQYRKSLPWRGEHYTTQNTTNNQEPGGQYIVDRIESVEAEQPSNLITPIPVPQVQPQPNSIQ